MIWKPPNISVVSLTLTPNTNPIIIKTREREREREEERDSYLVIFIIYYDLETTEYFGST
jgi:hypothetical protein